MQLDESQNEAISKALSSYFQIINGGAGTGKTTIIRIIANELGNNAVLCAFAGKAAARIREATKKDASTIHRMLKFNGEQFLQTSLRGCHVIIDEASMIHSSLLAEICSRNPERIVLVGDQAQLPPVGRGQPFHDLINIHPEKVHTLTTCYRNAEAIYQAANMIREGRTPARDIKSESEEYEIVSAGTQETAHSAILEMVEAGMIDFDRDIILIPKNGSDEQPATVRGLNFAIKSIVNPDADNSRPSPGDRIMNTKNYPDLDIWNGTTGTMDSMDEDGNVRIITDEKVRDYKLDLTNEVWLDKKKATSLELGYALSVHKSQGSQYRRVIFVCLFRDARMLLTRQMIYTAVTRAREHCIIVGDIKAMQAGIANIALKQTILQEIHNGILPVRRD